MPTNATLTVKHRDWRTIVFIVVAGIVGLLELTEFPLHSTKMFASAVASNTQGADRYDSRINY